MSTHKAMISELSRTGNGRTLTIDELVRLKKILLECYLDVAMVCEKNNLRIMLGGGSCLGAIRHHGFIPWDDDFDINMPRKDFEELKTIFEKELGDKYILNAPNFSSKPSNRFPKVLIKGTKLIELGTDDKDETGMIKIDIFTAENIPENKIVRKVKGIYCNLIMAIAGSVQFIEWYKRDKDNPVFQTKIMKKSNKIRKIMGLVFSIKPAVFWFNWVDKACQYNKKSDLVGFPTGRNHYFGEIHNSSDIFPLAEAVFEGNKVYVPNNVKKYLTKLYGASYMEIPPIEKRESHLFLDIQFGN